MSWDSNVYRDWRGSPVKHFTSYPTPGSSGVDGFNQTCNQDLSVCDGNRVNTYVFPKFSLIGPLLRFLALECSCYGSRSIDVSSTRVVVVMKYFVHPQCFGGREGIIGCAPFPSKDGFIPGSSPYTLLAFKIRKKYVYRLTGETFSLFSRLVSRLFQLTVSCRVCSKPNDFDFRYWQRCGYQCQTRSHQTWKSLKVPIHLCSITERKTTLAARRQATPVL